MKKWVSILLTLLFICNLFVWPCFAISDDWKLVVKVKGTVESQKKSETNWVNIWQSRMLTSGDKTRTGNDSRANIRLADQSIITIGANTVVEMSTIEISKDKRNVKCVLDYGKIKVKVGKFFGTDSNFEVETPNAVLAARGTEFYVEQQKITKQDGAIGLTTYVMCFSGTVEGYVSETGQTFTCDAGQAYGVTPAGDVVPNPLVTPSGQPTVGTPTTDGTTADSDADLAQSGTADTSTDVPSGDATTTTTTTTTGTDSATGTSTTNQPPVYNPGSTPTGTLPIVIQ